MLDPETAPPSTARPSPAPYDKRRLSYANTFPDPWKRIVIRSMEWATGKLRLLRMVRRFERMGPAVGPAFWHRALRIMDIAVTTPDAEIRGIPARGPVVLVANHPHGLVDGIVLAELIGRVRNDYKILTRSLLTGVAEIEDYLIPVPFPHEPDARAQGLRMRDAALAHLAADGLVAVFPAGSVAVSETWRGPAVEGPWAPFTAALIQRSGATVVPVRFTGHNSRAYQIANQVSPTLRQGLLLHEVVRACGVAQAPIVGAALLPKDWRRLGSGRIMAAALRQKTLTLTR